MCAINCHVYLEWGGEAPIFIPTCFRILVINIQQAVSAPCGLEALGNFHISKKEPRNSGQKITLSPYPVVCALIIIFLPSSYVEQHAS